MHQGPQSTLDILFIVIWLKTFYLSWHTNEGLAEMPTTVCLHLSQSGVGVFYGFISLQPNHTWKPEDFGYSSMSIVLEYCSFLMSMSLGHKWGSLHVSADVEKVRMFYPWYLVLLLWEDRSFWLSCLPNSWDSLTCGAVLCWCLTSL